MRASSRMIAWTVLVGVATPGLIACGPGFQDLPLPGTSVSGDTYRLDAVFDDALNLSEGARVKVNGVLVGRVQEIRADGFHAVAEMELRSDVTLAEDSTARLRYDTPLGEMFVHVTPGKGEPLEDGDTLPATSTETAPTVEDTLSQASLLINGGGLGQLQTINEELNNAIGGQEDTVRSVIRRSRTFLNGANQSATGLDAVLRELAAASQTLASRRQVFRAALRELGPAARVLQDNTTPLVTLLGRTEHLTTRANRTLELTQDALVQVLEQLGPILDEILSAEPSFVHGLASLARADRRISEAIPGDFIGLDALITVDLAALLGGSGSDGGEVPGDGPLPGVPQIPGLPSLPGLSNLGLISGLLGLQGSNRNEAP